MATIVVYFCWLCDKPVSENPFRAPHYETGNVLYFCSPAHWVSYLELLQL